MAGMSTHQKKSTTITFSLSAADAEWLKDHAWVTRRSVSQIMREQIEHLRREADNPYTRNLAGKLAAKVDREQAS
jgi:hypothetical protein